MNDKTKPAPPEPTDAKSQLFAVTKAFWLGDKPCAEGEKVLLTDSQAKRLGEAVTPAKAA
jgi:hypothetical protein